LGKRYIFYIKDKICHIQHLKTGVEYDASELTKFIKSDVSPFPSIKAMDEIYNKQTLCAAHISALSQIRVTQHDNNKPHIDLSHSSLILEQCENGIDKFILISQTNVNYTYDAFTNSAIYSYTFKYTVFTLTLDADEDKHRLSVHCTCDVVIPNMTHELDYYQCNQILLPEPHIFVSKDPKVFVLHNNPPLINGRGSYERNINKKPLNYAIIVNLNSDKNMIKYFQSCKCTNALLDKLLIISNDTSPNMSWIYDVDTMQIHQENSHYVIYKYNDDDSIDYIIKPIDTSAHTYIVKS
jgi:hypothetical protein